MFGRNYAKAIRIIKTSPNTWINTRKRNDWLVFENLSSSNVNNSLHFAKMITLFTQDKVSNNMQV